MNKSIVCAFTGFFLLLFIWTLFPVLAREVYADEALKMPSTVPSDRNDLSGRGSPSITFDVETSSVGGEGGKGAQAISLGTLSSNELSTSDKEKVGAILVHLDTSMSSGASVTVVGENGGLRSVAADPDKILTLNAPESSITAGMEGFGLCVGSVVRGANGSLVPGSQYDAGGSFENCTPKNGGTPTVGRVETVPIEILSTGGGPITGGSAEILTKAAVSATTPMSDDYFETLTFVASSAF